MLPEKLRRLARVGGARHAVGFGKLDLAHLVLTWCSSAGKRRVGDGRDLGRDDLGRPCAGGRRPVPASREKGLAMRVGIHLMRFDGQEPTEGLLNHIEVAIRAFDPCLSCATHAMGKMPLSVEILDASGALVQRLVRDAERPG